METATGRVILDKQGSDVPVSRITPAEVLVLRSIHMNSVGKDPVTNLKVDKEQVKRSGAQEKARLLGKYAKDVIEKMFPGVSPSLPTSFDELPVAGDAAPVDIEMENGAPKLPEQPKQEKFPNVDDELMSQSSEELNSIVTSWNGGHPDDEAIVIPEGASKRDVVDAILIAGGYTPKPR